MQLYLKQTIPIFLVFFLLYCPAGRAQRFFTPIQDIPLSKNTQSLPIPWGGGLNTPLLQMADLSGDRQQELIALDRSSQSILVFRWQENRWQAEQELGCLLPANLSNWFIMQDYDGDGRKDIFTFTPAGIRVFRNTASKEEAAVWEAVSEGLNYQSINGPVNLLVNSSDVPAITDVDGDGDLDILAYDPSGGGGLEYYQNRSVEETGSPGLAPFVKESRRWGGLSECACGVFAFNNQPCSSKREGSRLLHTGGKSLLLYDVDKDGDLDLLNGFEECTELYYLENSGSNVAPRFESVQTTLPGADEKVHMAFPAAFVLQNPSQEEALLAVSSQLNRNKFREDFSRSIWLYTESGSGSEAPTYTLQTRAFLQEDMLDVGEAAIPAFMDVDADGDLDMLLGSYGKPAEEGFYGSLWLYENVGTEEEPAFQLQTEDYLSLSNHRFIGLSPQFIDFNKDGKRDLLFIATEPERLQRRAYLLLNQGKTNEAARFLSEQLQEIPVFLNSQEFPHFYDVSGDQLPDLLIGSFDGSLHYYLNTGTAQSPSFELQTRSFLGLDLDNYRRPLIPSAGDLSGNGKADLLLADGSGGLRYLANFTELSPESAPEAIPLALCPEQETAPWLGRRNWPVAVRLRSRQSPMLVIGNQMGGLWLVEQQGSAGPPAGEVPQLLVYPNPLVYPREEVYVKSNFAALIRLYSLDGRLLQEFEVSANQRQVLPAKNLTEGTYLLQAYCPDGSATQRLIIIK